MHKFREFFSSPRTRSLKGAPFFSAFFSVKHFLLNLKGGVPRKLWKNSIISGTLNASWLDRKSNLCLLVLSSRLNVLNNKNRTYRWYNCINNNNNNNTRNLKCVIIEMWFGSFIEKFKNTFNSSTTKIYHNFIKIMVS